MTIAIWPDALPQYVLVDGFSRGMPDGRLITKVDAGPPKTRQTTSAAVTPAAASIVVDIDTQCVFDNFWNETLNLGTRPFLIRNPHFHGVFLTNELGQIVTNEADVAVLVDAWWLCMFADAPQKSAVLTNYVQISFTLSILP